MAVEAIDYRYPIEHNAQEPVSNIAIYLPGQDVQKPGMFSRVMEHPAGLEVVQRADRFYEKEFGFRISEIAAKDADPAILGRTEFTQPAVYTLAVAIHNINKHHHKKEGYATLPLYITGNSMAIVTATMLSGALPFEGGLELIGMRGWIMQEDLTGEPITAMRATLNSTEEQVRALLMTYSDLDMCLINSDNIFVYGGPLKPLQEMTEELAHQKVKTVPVKADRAMHSRYTRAARGRFDAYVDGLLMQNPLIPLLGTLTGEPITTIEGIKEELKYGLDHTFDNRKILTFLDHKRIHLFSEVNENGTFAKNMERMFEAIAAHKIEAGVALSVVVGVSLYEVLTRHHPKHK